MAPPSGKVGRERLQKAAVAARDRLRLAVKQGRWAWARQWEFWLAVGLGGFLRLWHLDTTQFLYDQAQLMTLARDGIVRGVLPITGIPYSIGALSPPFSVYLLMPLVALGKDPQAAALAIALWNVLGIALCYAFALAYFGRRVAASSTLLLATCGKAIVFSSYIWQTNCLPPLLMLWALTLYAGCVRGNRRWFALNVALLTMIVLLHPLGVLLLPVLLAALLLSPQPPRLGEYTLAAGLVAVLVAPTAIWEVVSGGSDFRLLRSLGAHAATLDVQVIRVLYQVVGAPAFRQPNTTLPFPILLSGSPYGALSAVYPALAAAVVIFYGLGYLVLTGLVLAPVRALWSGGGGATGHTDPWHRLISLLGAIWHGLRASPIWRAYLLLWLWLVVPLLALLRHSVAIFPHYLMILSPAVFVLAGIGVDWLLEHSQDALRQLGHVAHLPADGRVRHLGPALVAALVGLLVVGQAAQSALYEASLASGKVNDVYYGYPLGEVQAADRALDALQHRAGATAVLISNPIWYYRQALDYLLVSERPDRTSFFGACLLLPAPGAGSALVVSTSSQNPAAALLPELPGVRRVATLPMPGSEPFAVYQVNDVSRALPGETPVVPEVFRDAAGDGLRLEGATLVAPRTLVLRWTALATTRAGQPPQRYQVHVRAPVATSTGQALLGTSGCEPTRWQTGQTLLTWTTLAPALASGAQPTPQASAAPVPASWAIDLLGATTAPWEPQLGPLRLLSARAVLTPWTQLSPTPALARRGAAAGGAAPAGDTYFLAASAIGQPHVPEPSNAPHV